MFSGQFIISATIVNQENEDHNNDSALIGGQLAVWNFQTKSLFGSLNFKVTNNFSFQILIGWNYQNVFIFIESTLGIDWTFEWFNWFGQFL